MTREFCLACVLALPCVFGPVPAAGDDAVDGEGGQRGSAPDTGAAISSRIETTARGERILVQTATLEAPVAAVWDAYTTVEGWRGWVVPVLEMDFRPGGLIQTHYDPEARIGDPGTNRLRVVNYVPHTLITLQADTTSNWPEFMKAEAENLYNVILFEPLSASRTRVVSYGVGYGTDQRYEEMLRFFVEANEQVLGQLKRYVEEQALTHIVAEISRADYEGDRPALSRLYGDLAPFVQHPELASRVLYWRGFALWRRALNGFNDGADPSEIEADLAQCATDFGEAAARDRAFVDAKAGLASCLVNHSFMLLSSDTARSRELYVQAMDVVRDALALAPDNPRLLWVHGANQWYSAPERGGGQTAAVATYEKGLALARQQQGSVTDPLEPSWGEPELLMNLAFAHLNRMPPDHTAAERHAEAALALVPHWRYVRDILLPQIREARQSSPD
jgi:uncharacterized protein YndB with AHSA1/START domain